jgi:hypothetical protein
MGGQNFATRSDDLRQNVERLSEMRKKRDAWFKANRGRLERETANAIAIELRQKGYYSTKTSIIDIIVSIEKCCARLGIPSRLQRAKYG